jgi:signal transduction histidine kinase
MTLQARAATLEASSASQLRPAYCLLVAPLAAIGAAVALAHLPDPEAVDVVRFILAVAWASAGVLVGVRRRSDRIGPIALGIASLIAGAMIFDAWAHPALARLLVGCLPAAGLHLFMALPDGRLGTRARRGEVLFGYAVGALVGLVGPHDSSGPKLWPIVLLSVAAAVIGLPAANSRYRRAGATDRRRMQWVGWALAVALELTLAIVALRLMATWPPHAPVAVLALTILIPASLVAGTHARMVARVDVLLTHTVALAGLTAVVILTYVAVVVSLGRTLHNGERSLLLLSMGAALFAALVYLPVRAKLSETANQLVYGEREAPDEALRTWGTRLTRAIPLDELLLQLTESLRKSMSLAKVEIFTGGDGRYELTAGVPHREAPPLMIGEKERVVVARAGVSGGTWLDVWIPQLALTNSANTRVAPIAHAGALLGLIVLTRSEEGEQFTEENDRVVTELARQVALALHNVQLDFALQASLDELRQTNVELQESRLRIVTAGDAERRKLERNLHDGAQQHLVAMAVKLRLAEELIEEDPVEATKVIDELRENLKDAIAELRALAHGIFPPLLSSGGLREALPAAAGRAALPTTVDTEGVGRYSAEIESTVYFCCLEAVQNAAKHAGPDAEIQVRVREQGRELVFEVIDDGVGFTPRGGGGAGHGFVNMTDRLGAVGGKFAVTSSPGNGTSIRGEIPLP